MIVLDEPGGGLLVVRQADHAAASAQLAAAWQRPALLPAGVWLRFLWAVCHHDDGWKDAEARPALDARGYPLSFKSLPEPQHVAVWQRSIDLAQAHDTYAGLLVALHARWLYTHMPAKTTLKNGAAVARFLQNTNAWVDRGLASMVSQGPGDRIAVEPRSLEVARALFLFFDWLSLLLAGALGSDPRTESLAFGPEASPLSIHFDGSQLDIQPWPFRIHDFHTHMFAVQLGQRRFRSPGELGRLMGTARPRRLSWRVGRKGQG